MKCAEMPKSQLPATNEWSGKNRSGVNGGWSLVVHWQILGIAHMGISKRVPQNGWLIMENPIKMDDLGVPLLTETPI